MVDIEVDFFGEVEAGRGRQTSELVSSRFEVDGGDEASERRDDFTTDFTKFRSVGDKLDLTIEI